MSTDAIKNKVQIEQTAEITVSVTVSLKFLKKNCQCRKRSSETKGHIYILRWTKAEIIHHLAGLKSRVKGLFF